MTLFHPSPSTLTSLLTTPKTILITGSSSGIGLSTALLLSTLNPSHNLILLDLHPPPPTFPHPTSHTLFHTCDITSWPSQRAAFAAGHARFGRIDCVFVNAGIAEHGDQFFTDEFDDDSEKELKEPDRRVLNLDMDAASDTTKLAIHYLRKNGAQRGGQIVLTASLAGYLASAGAPLYSAAKHGVVGLMRALKNECMKLGIAISVVAPAITVTPILTAQGRRDGAPHEVYAQEMAKVGVPINKPESVALAVCWLFDQGMAGNGAGIFVQADRFADLERGLARSRELWMGKEMLDLFRGGRGAPLFDRIDGEAKAKI